VLSPATVRRAGELLPKARVEVVTDAPHSMYWERPDLFNHAIRRFLKELASASPPRGANADAPGTTRIPGAFSCHGAYAGRYLSATPSTGCPSCRQRHRQRLVVSLA
jgi:hypothetical protein